MYFIADGGLAINQGRKRVWPDDICIQIMDTYHFNNSVKANFKEKGKTLDANIKNELIDTINTLVECSEL